MGANIGGCRLRKPVGAHLRRAGAVVFELDYEAKCPPCSEAEIIRLAATEIERLRRDVAEMGASPMGKPGVLYTILPNGP